MILRKIHKSPSDRRRAGGCWENLWTASVLYGAACSCRGWSGNRRKGCLSDRTCNQRRDFSEIESFGWKTEQWYSITWMNYLAQKFASNQQILSIYCDWNVDANKIQCYDNCVNSFIWEISWIRNFILERSGIWK